jgi:hypothetical protein
MLTEMPATVRGLSRADKARLIGMLAADLAEPERPPTELGRPVNFADFGMAPPEIGPASPATSFESNEERSRRLVEEIGALGSIDIWSPRDACGAAAELQKLLEQEDGRP